jgi:hypothetical protein
MPTTTTTTTTSTSLNFPTEELRLIRYLLQNETAWDRDADTGGFNSYHRADSHTRPGSGVLAPVHEEAEWKLLNTAMLRIDQELERRQQAIKALAKATTYTDPVDHAVDFQYHRLGRG